ncbi:hypothetical protein COHA_006420 [Chlorella ohadii]|uniref:F-box domain-containing protein n=1 Tax=Chlorella ohadii TaxID=2649997 RepID=A0AAD5H587_9CHLO|nr:hypothetical protein COHA_006420 [Chlorella ohadii]
MESLPDVLLGRIFALAGRQAGPAITLVCRRWHGVFYSEPAVWRSLELTATSLQKSATEGQAPQWFAAKARLLRLIGGFVQRLFYSQMIADENQEWDIIDMQQLAADGASEWQLGSSVLAQLSTASLEWLHLEWASVDAAAAAALVRLSSLTELALDCHGKLPRCAVAALSRMPQLLSLELRFTAFPARLGTALQRLTQLTYLTCSSGSALPELSTVLPLTRLRQLGWVEQRQDGSLQVDLQQLLARLPQLECCRVDSYADILSSLQVGGAELASCAVEGCDQADGTVEELRLVAVVHMPSLQQLVAAALPASTQPSQLRSLAICSSSLSPPALVGCPFLGHLTSLSLSGCASLDGGPEPMVEVLLQQAPRLQSLDLPFFFWTEALPAAVTSRTGLTYLCLAANSLTELPPGPYLHSLEVLDLGRNRWARVPPALAAATSLTDLCLGSDLSMVWPSADVDILSQMPRLRRLHLDDSSVPEHLLGLLSQRMPHLQITR